MRHDDRPQTTRPRRAPRRWGGFVHLLARFYQDYERAVLRAARRKRRRRVDIDTQPSLEGTPWGLHWSTIGRNRLHDPRGHFGPGKRVDELTDDAIARLRGPKGQHPRSLAFLLDVASQRRVEVEVEGKGVIPGRNVDRLVARRRVQAMLKRGDLVFKTLAQIGDPVARLRPWHEAGVPTLLSFTTFRRRGISTAAAWPVTDFVRGRARWRP